MDPTFVDDSVQAELIKILNNLFVSRADGEMILTLEKGHITRCEYTKRVQMMIIVPTEDDLP